MKKNILKLSALILVAGIYVFFAVPNLNPLYADGALFWLVLLSLGLLLLSLSKSPIVHVLDRDGQPTVQFNKNAEIKKWVLYVIAAGWILFVLIQLICTPLFFWKQYRDQMPEPEAMEFSSEMQAMDLQQVPIVDIDLARTLADKKLGEHPALGSQVELGEPTLQNVNNELIWVVPLQHSGFFKWLSNLDGSAGYVLVSATNLSDVTYVDDYKIKVQPDCYFLSDLMRRVRLTKGLFTGLTDYAFELDDTGHPYWVVTTYHNLCGFSLPEADGVILVDAQSGAVSRYSLADVPAWVDRVQPEPFLLDQINNKGTYIHGFFNFSNFEKFQASEGENIIYNNGRCYLFTGITSVGSDESIIGFYMIDMVTKEPALYRTSGATEYSAQLSAQGKVQDLRYTATAPLLLNLFDEPTYFMTLKDSAQLIKKYAFVSVKDFMIVGVGDTIQEAQADYGKVRREFSDRPSFEEHKDPAVTKSVSGTVDRINFTVTGGETVYSLTLKEAPGRIFTAPLSLSPSLPLTRPGDAVTLEYPETENPVLTAFQNKSLWTE